MAAHVVKARKKILNQCLTCFLCNNLFVEPTAISLCLHTFCRKCIYDRLSDGELNSCPVCNVDLGFIPVEKLRRDHCLQNIRLNIFPLESRKTDTPEVPPSISLPAKRKKRLLPSSLDSTPEVLIQSGSTEQSAKASSSQSFPSAFKEPINLENLFTQQHNNSVPLLPHFAVENKQPNMCFNGTTEAAQGDAGFLSDIWNYEFQDPTFSYYAQMGNHYFSLTMEYARLMCREYVDALSDRDIASGEAKKFKDLYHNSCKALEEERSLRSSTETQRDLLQNEIKSLKNELALLQKHYATSSDQLRLFQLRISELDNSNLVQNLKEELEALRGQLSKACNDGS